MEADADVAEAIDFANTAGVIAAKLMELVEEAGFPPGVINTCQAEAER